MNVLGLIGNPVSHSRSPEIFRNFFIRDSLTNWEYRLFPLDKIGDLPGLIQETLLLRGLNVTVPYKTAVMPLLDETDPDALAIGAVNTITLRYENGRVIKKGYNTDVFGFEKSLADLSGFLHSAALVLGTGGSSKAVVSVLRKHGMPYTLVSRSSDRGLVYEDLTRQMIEKHTLIINTTPIGMGKQAGNLPELDYSSIGPGHLCVDLIYEPARTTFLERCEHQGAKTANGLEMLRYQAEKSWELFKQDSGLF